MAIDPSTEYSGKITAPDADYDYGSAKAVTTPTSQDGTPWSLKLVNDLFGFQQALLKVTGIVPSGNAETQLASQYLSALSEIITTLNFGEDVVNTDNYEVTTKSRATKYEEGLYFLKIANANTGAADVDYDSLGIKNILRGDGSALSAGDLPAGVIIPMIYNGTEFRLLIINGHDHSAAGKGGNLGDIQATEITLTGAASSPPDANTLVKDNICKGWIIFDGTGTISILGSYNVSGIIDNGVGNYTITWDRNFSNVNYCTVGSASKSGDDAFIAIANKLVGSVNTVARDDSGGVADVDEVNLAAWGDQA
jgi:hypothetical protein